MKEWTLFFEVSGIKYEGNEWQDATSTCMHSSKGHIMSIMITSCILLNVGSSLAWFMSTLLQCTWCVKYTLQRNVIILFIFCTSSSNIHNMYLDLILSFVFSYIRWQSYRISSTSTPCFILCLYMYAYCSQYNIVAVIVSSPYILIHLCFTFL